MIKQKTEWMDTLRTVATLSVILVHVTTSVVNQNYHRNMSYWWIGNIIDCSIRFCVPLFLMLSGASLLGKDYPSYWDFIKRRMMRVVIPFVFWSLLYIVYGWYVAPPKEQPHSADTFGPWLSIMFWEKDISKHFWYIYTILVLYPFIPFVGKWIRSLNKQSAKALMGGWIIISLIFFYFVLFPYDNKFVIKPIGYLGYMGYMILGYYLSLLDFSSVKSIVLAWIGFIFSILATAFITYYYSEYSHKLNLKFYSYLCLIAILQSTCIFILIKSSIVKNKILVFLRDTISNYSYGIYLVHVMILGFLYLNKIYWTMAHPLISIPLVAIICLLLSFSVIFILRKIPFGKYISG